MPFNGVTLFATQNQAVVDRPDTCSVSRASKACQER